MSRSSWKCSYIHPEFISQYDTALSGDEIILLNRSTVLTEDMLNLKISVYNGIRFFSFTVDAEKLGHRIGEFASTRKKPLHKKKKK